MHIIHDFSLWKAINEDELPSREKEKDPSKNNKAVIIPIDNNTFKIKLVNNQQVVINGKLPADGFANLLTFIKGQRAIIDYYKDLKTLYTVDSATNQAVLAASSPNMVIYSIAKDNNRKEVLIFKIVSKTELMQNDPSKPRIPDNVLFLKDDEVGGIASRSSIVSGGGVDTKKVEKLETSKIPGLTLPIKGASINGSTSAPLVEFITKAYRAVAAKLTGNPILPKVKEEVKANLLGVSSQTFVKALNSGFGIKDSRFGEDVEEDVTSTLVGKLDKPDELNVTLFGNVAAPTAKVDTGDIVVPADGFRGGMQGNAELKKFQDLLKTKLAVKLRDHKTYQEFVKAGLKNKKGFVGNYGTLTANLITLLKSIAKPSYPNQNGNIIEPQLVSMVRAINESSMYLALDGFTLITEEDSFDFTVAPNYSPTVSDSGEVESSSNGVVRKKSASSASYAAKPADLKDVKKFQQYVIKQSGSGWSSGMDDGKWGPKTSAAWTKYGETFKKSGGNTGATTTEGKIDEVFTGVLKSIKTFMGTDSNFAAYSGGTWSSDKASQAWRDSIKVRWKKEWSPSLEKAKPLIETLKDEGDKKKANSNYSRIFGMFTKTEDGSFYKTIVSTKDDIWSFQLPLLTGGTKVYDIRTDF